MHCQIHDIILLSKALLWKHLLIALIVLPWVVAWALMGKLPVLKLNTCVSAQSTGAGLAEIFGILCAESYHNFFDI